jgi:hypothetical protein
MGIQLAVDASAVQLFFEDKSTFWYETERSL